VNNKKRGDEVKIPSISIYHDLVWFGGIESSELDLLKKLKYNGYKTYLGHKDQYYTKHNSLAKMSAYAEIKDINQDILESDILIYSSLVFPYWQLENQFKNKKRIGWVHFVPDKQMNYTLLDDELFKKTIDKWVVVSEYAKKHLEAYIKPDNIVVIHNTIDIDKLYHLAQEKPDIEFKDDELKIIVVGRISKDKGFSEAVELAKLMQEANIKYKIYFVGGGAGAGSKYIDDLSESIKGLNIEMLGYQDNPYKYMKHCDYTLIMSKDESWCLVNDESWLLGVPTITSELEAIKERKDYQKYNIMVDRELKNIDLKAILNKNDELKANLKGYKYHNDYDKWCLLFKELMEAK